MYRLVALPFLKQGMAVAIVGYRTWPDADVHGQVDDLERAASFLAQQFPDLAETLTQDENPGHFGTCLIGHSSGAHISLLMLVDRARRKIQTGSSKPLQFDSFVGLSGPYDISHHFDYEASRGVEELSPMKPVCGSSREAFRENSPALRLMQNLTNISESNASIQDSFPRMLLVHGIEDSTVPFTATAEAARILRSCGISPCDEAYVAKIGHQDTVMEMMIGGKTRDVVIGWMQDPSKNSDLSSVVAVGSKL
jgi:acetyl esterase/lipase